MLFGISKIAEMTADILESKSAHMTLSNKSSSARIVPKWPHIRLSKSAAGRVTKHKEITIKTLQF